MTKTWCKRWSVLAKHTAVWRLTHSNASEEVDMHLRGC